MEWKIFVHYRKLLPHKQNFDHCKMFTQHPKYLKTGNCFTPQLGLFLTITFCFSKNSTVKMSPTNLSQYLRKFCQKFVCQKAAFLGLNWLCAISPKKSHTFAKKAILRCIGLANAPWSHSCYHYDPSRCWSLINTLYQYHKNTQMRFCAYSTTLSFKRSSVTNKCEDSFNKNLFLCENLKQNF